MRPRAPLATLGLSAVVGLLLALVLVLAGCGRSPFDATGPDGAPLTPESVVTVLQDAGLEVDATPVEWDRVPGFVDGLFLSVRTGEEEGDESASAFVVQFDSHDARDAAIDVVAWRPFDRHAVHFWTWGPLVIAVEGQRDYAAVTAIDDALRDAGAR